jgi:hypothetical protein
MEEKDVGTCTMTGSGFGTELWTDAGAVLI